MTEKEPRYDEEMYRMRQHWIVQPQGRPERDPDAAQPIQSRPPRPPIGERLSAMLRRFARPDR